MVQKHVAVKAKDSVGNEVQAVSQENDFPLPPVQELEKLHKFRPDLVDRVLELTAEEAKKRRERMLVIDKYVHRQNMVSSIGSIGVALIAFAGSIYLAINNHDWAAVGIVGSTLGVVVYAISQQNKH